MASYAHNMDEPPIIAHVQGGDLTGGVDDAQRHAISKLANIHFCSTPRSAKRLEALGEVWERIYVVGDPHLDGLAQYIPLEPDVLSAALQKVGLGADRPYVVGMLHPDTMGTHLTTNMYDALEALGPEMQALVIHPCNDRGWQAIADRWAKASIPAFRWLPQETFGPLLAGAACVVGNSSMGIIEAPFLRTPTVNIGDRQQGRERGSLNMTVDVPSKASVKDIKRAIEAAVSIRMPGCVLYGAGQSHKLITEALLRLHPDRAKLRYKPQVMP
jgi:UDP-hydrolysing UDP-N-acetyl-D-glucosamine 2-epimerase